MKKKVKGPGGQNRGGTPRPTEDFVRLYHTKPEDKLQAAAELLERAEAGDPTQLALFGGVA